MQRPEWATGPEAWGGGTALTNHEQNKRENTRRYDVVVYGDSITANVRDTANTPWRTIMYDPFWSDLRVAWWGVPGNDVDDLAWRLMGPERPIKDPKVIVFWIGTNDLSQGRSPIEHLDFLVGWTRGTMKSEIVIMNLTPTTHYSTTSTNKKLRKLAAKHGAVFAECGKDLDMADPSMSMDGLHLMPSAYQIVMRCLAPTVRQLVKK